MIDPLILAISAGLFAVSTTTAWLTLFTFPKDANFAAGGKKRDPGVLMRGARRA